MNAGTRRDGFVLLEPTKATMPEAVTWAYHCARVGQTRMRVTYDRQLRRWRIWKAI